MADYITGKQAKEEFGFDRSSLRRFEEQGILDPFRTPGRQRRYTRDQLEALLKQTPMKPPPIAVSTNGNSPRPDFREYGVSGLNRFSGSLFEEKLRELRGRAGRIKYSEMRRNNPVIAAVFFGLVNALKQPSVRAKPASDSLPDQKAALWLETTLNDMSFSWMDTLDLILQPLFEQGFTLLELVYKRRLGHEPPPYTESPSRSKYNDGKTGWRKWAPRPAESLADGSEWIYDVHGGLQGINQQPDTMGGLVQPLVNYPAFRDIEGQENIRGVYSIPIEKLLHFRTTLHPANSPEGMSLLRPMYLAYHFSTNLQEIEGIGAERDLAGIPVMYLGEGTTLSGPDSDYEESKSLVVNLRNDEQTGIVIPHPKMGTAGEGRGVLLELLSTGGRRNWDVGSIIERYEKRMAMSCLAQFIMLGMQSVGSYALSRHQGDLFVLAASAFLQAVADVINRHAVPRLFSFNAFPGITGYPELAFSPVGIPDLEAVSDFVNKLVERQVLTPDAELERHLRQLGGLPAPVVTVTTPDTPDKQERGVEETALLVRRLSMAIQPLQELMVLSSDDAMAMLRPLVEDLKQALGVAGATSGEGFEEAQAEAAGQMREAVRDGEKVEAAANQYVSLMKHWKEFSRAIETVKKNLRRLNKAEWNNQLTPEGRKALSLTEGLEDDIRQRWAKLMADIEAGTSISQALSSYEQDAMSLITDGMREAWLVGHSGTIREAEQGAIDEAIATQQDYLEKFMKELEGELKGAKEEDRGGMLLGSAARAIMYGGSIWLLYNLARTFNAPKDSIWEWQGPSRDGRICRGCQEQMDLGARPLSQIKVLPTQAECLTRCRHELVRVK